MKTGFLQAKTVIYKEFLDKDDAYRKHLAEQFKQELLGEMRLGVDYFVWTDEAMVSVAEYYGIHRDEWPDDADDFGQHWLPPWWAMNNGEMVLVQRGLLLLIGWPKCEPGDACIGRPEWNDYLYRGMVSVPGPDGKMWTFFEERNPTPQRHVHIWRRGGSVGVI